MRPVLKEFINRIYQDKIAQFRAVIVHKDGKLWGEVFHAPRVPYNIHSVSKSFVSTAIGFAIDEGILTLEDKVVDAFPEYLPDDVSDWLGGLKLKHLLKMSSGHTMGSIYENFMKFEHVENGDWLRQYLHQPIECEPGTRFHYQSGDTYTAGAILQKKVGMTLVEYLKSRLFDPLQIETPFWLTSPEGYNIGYTGLWLKTEDLIKLAELYRNNGNWYGRRLLSQEWVVEATSKQIDTSTGTDQKHDTVGYGYQIWLGLDESFRGSGMGGQHTIAIPKYKTCIAFSAFDMGKETKTIDLIWEVIVPHLT